MEQNILPVLILKNVILFPGNEIRFELETDHEKELLSLCESYYNKNVLTIVHSLEGEEDTASFPKLGVIGFITMTLKLPDHRIRVVIKGTKRVQISSYEKDDTLFFAHVSAIVVPQLNDFEEIAYKRSLEKGLNYYIEHNPNASNSIVSQISGITDLGLLTDMLTVYIPGDGARKLDYLYETDPTSRIIMLLKDMNCELKVLSLEEELEEKVNVSLDEAQKNYILEEKLKTIKQELGISFDKEDETSDLENRIEALSAPNRVKKRLKNELARYVNTPSSSPELGMMRSYMETLLSLPWSYETEDEKDLNEARRYLDQTHYGLQEIKERILEYLALLKRTDHKNSPIICLVGPPGVGKTSLARSIAYAMKRHYTKISVGGINDEAEIVGHRRAYLGSSYGRIISGMRKAGSVNPVFVIDEIDKMTKDYKKDPAASLLEILDKEQNDRFYDNYIEEEYDLSKVLFICTANYKEQIPKELLDRLEVIEIASYTEIEKQNICQKHIIPKAIIDHGLTDVSVNFSRDAIFRMIRCYTKEAGVRELERVVNTILRKIVKELVVDHKEITSFRITEQSLKHYLGREKFPLHPNRLTYPIGMVNAMSYTIYGGDILKIEVNYYRGKGDIIMTGSLGNVFVESAQIALSYIKSNYKKFQLIYDLLEHSDIHIHVPEGAIKKEGPSAGVAITTAIISAFTEKKIPSNISMTGEITLHGDILAVGGLKEKIIGAKKAGIKKIFLPRDNQDEFDEIEDSIKEDIEFIFVDKYQEVAKALGMKQNF